MYQKKMCDLYYNTNFDNIDTSIDGIVGNLQNAINKFCPILKVNCSHDDDKHKPWLTNDIKSLMNEKNRLHNKYLRKPSSYGHRYRTTRNILNNMKKCVKNIFFMFSIVVRTIVKKNLGSN